MLGFKYIIISPSCYCGLSTVSLLDAAWGRQTLDDLLVENQTLTKKWNTKCLSVSFLFPGPDIIKEVTVSGLSLRENESKLAFAQGILIVVIQVIQSCSVKTADDIS